MSTIDPFHTTLYRWIDVFSRRSMRNFIRFARESGLSMSQLGALFHLHRCGSSGVSDLGDHLGVTSAAASQMLDRLLVQGLILRVEDPSDRRVKQITLTDKGSQILSEAVRARHGWVNDLSEVLSDHEKEQITISLKIMLDKVNHIEPVAES